MVTSVSAEKVKYSIYLYKDTIMYSFFLVCIQEIGFVWIVSQNPQQSDNLDENSNCQT